MRLTLIPAPHTHTYLNYIYNLKLRLVAHRGRFRQQLAAL